MILQRCLILEQRFFALYVLAVDPFSGLRTVVGSFHGLTIFMDPFSGLRNVVGPFSDLGTLVGPFFWPEKSYGFIIKNKNNKQNPDDDKIVLVEPIHLLVRRALKNTM